MTVSNENNKTYTTGNDVTTAFPFNNVLFLAADITVILRDDSVTPATDTLQVITTNYTVAIAGDFSSATVNMVVAPASTETLVIFRKQPDTQTTPYPEGGEFPAASHEDALDRGALQSQTQEELILRSIKLPATVQTGGGAAFDGEMNKPSDVLTMIFWNPVTLAFQMVNGITDKVDIGLIATDDEVLIADTSDGGKLKRTQVADFLASGIGGDVVGPSSSIDNTIPRFDGTTGKIIQGSLVVVDDAGNMDGIRSISIDYDAGALAPTQQEAVNLVNVDESLSTGGEVFGYAMIGIDEGSAELFALGVGIDVNPIRQNSGSFGDADTILVLAVDQTTALSGGGAGNISVFVLDDDTITIGDAAQYAEIGFIVDTPSSGGGVAPTFEYSTGVGTWATFSPSDGTNGFRNTGVVIFNPSDLAGWVVGTGTEFLVRITRTRNTLTTTPILDLVQIAAATIYQWDKNGDVSINNIRIAGDI